MRNRFLSFILLSCLYITSLFAQNVKTNEVLLKTNEKYSGEIIFQSEELVVLKTEDGSRFQFPLNDIKTIRKDSKQTYPFIEETSENSELDSKERKITLKSGDIYYGEIIVENEQIVMIRTSGGARFQFPANEVKSIEKNFVGESSIQKDDWDDNNFVMMIDVQGGTSYSKQAYSWAPAIQASLVLGVKDVFVRNTFLGGGIGYNILFPTDYINTETIAFIPVFVRLRSIVGKNHIAPYIEMDAGYSFSLNADFGGGMMLKLSAGVACKLTYRTILYFGVYAGLQNFSGKLTQANDWGTYNYDGNTATQNIGAKVALRF